MFWREIKKTTQVCLEKAKNNIYKKNLLFLGLLKWDISLIFVISFKIIPSVNLN